MNPRRHATLGRVLTVSAALAILILAGSLAFAAFASIMQTARERDRELASAGRYAHLYVQSRLGHAHMLALDLSLGRDTLPAGTAGVTHVRIGPDGKLLSSSTGRTLPRLQANLPRLSEGDASGIELDDQGTLVAVGSALSPHGVVVVFMPFTTADVQAIHEATGREVSLYAGRTCVATTLRKAGGAAATGLVLSSDELAALATGALTRTTDLLLDGSRYRQTLQPLLGLDGGVVGAVGVAERPPDVADLLPHLWPSLLAWALGGAILALLWAAVGMRLRRPLVMLERDLGQLVSRQHANGLSGDYCLAELDTLVQHVNQLCAARAALAQSSERLNDRLVQMQALAMLGRLTSGVAHDLNNPLATIRGLADIMLTSELDAEVRSELESIRKQAEYSGHMVSTLLAYARRQRGEPEKVNLNEIISQSLELLAFQARVTNTRCEMRLDERLPLTWGDPSQLQQVVLNLVNNAMQAMASSHGGGTLRVESAWSPGEG
ncbi:MAG: sensor histidine kinase, partial [Thiobacillaceae bacterium]